VLVSSTVKDLVVGSDIAFTERGSRELKGVPGEWSLFAVAGVWTPISVKWSLCRFCEGFSRHFVAPNGAAGIRRLAVRQGRRAWLSRAKIWQRVDAAGDD
jgi:hypothetical protein